MRMDEILQGRQYQSSEIGNAEARGERQVISDKVVKALCTQLLKEDDCLVKEVVAAAIGGIGLPEA